MGDRWGTASLLLPDPVPRERSRQRRPNQIIVSLSHFPNHRHFGTATYALVIRTWREDIRATGCVPMQVMWSNSEIGPPRQIRSSTLATCTADHLPWPRAVGMPVEPGCDLNHPCTPREMIAWRWIKRRGRSCPPFSTSSTANTAVPASPKCGNSFYSGLRAMKSQKRIAMPSVLTARLIGAVARLGDSQCEASHRTG